MLLAFNLDRNEALKRSPSLPQIEFESALRKHPGQVFTKTTTNINAILQKHQAFRDLEEPRLNVDEAWQGLKFKAERPHIFTIPIVAAAVIESSRLPTTYGEVYDRLSIQPSWLTGNLVIVKEETHIDDEQKKVTFLGRPFDMNEAKALLLPQLITEMFDKKSEKALKILPKEMNKSEAFDYLSSHFETLFSNEAPPLFHVQHGITGEVDEPLETWALVRLADEPKTLQEQEATQQLKEKIASSISWKLYLETLKELEKITSQNKLKKT